jgi:uncharacterized protein (DUF1501 family)
MEKKSASVLDRREFIRQAACAAVGTAAMSCAIRDLRFMNAAVAQSNITDYKALVCIFLAGGNDSNNLVIPTTTSEYNNYAAVRTPVLAIPQSSLLPITPLVSDGHGYGLHPCCSQLQSLFGQGRLAVLFNTGTLIYPLTKALYNATPSKRPPQLFSHADQVTQWQTSVPDQPALTGWGGRCADLLNAVQPGAPVSLSVTLAGANTFEVGNRVSQYSVSTAGAVSLQGVSGARLQALTNILGLPYPNLQASAYAGVANHSINSGALLNTAILAPPILHATDVQFWTTPFPGSGTFQVSHPDQRRQIQFVPRAAAQDDRPPDRSRAARGARRLRHAAPDLLLPGRRLRSAQRTNRCTNGGSVLNGAHSNLFAELSQCMNAFQSAMDQIGTLHGDPNFAQRVTAFTCSDFGRTFPANGQGSDHGWGSHHLIMGGAVHGQQTYGTFPTLTVGGPDDTSTGRWIPTTACDQYFSTLATWFGVDNSNLTTVFPNIGRFSSPNLGFI